MKKNKDVYGVSSWYMTLADYTFPTTFVKLRESEVQLIADGKTEGDEVDSILSRLNNAQKSFSGSSVVFADIVAPTDTDRFRDRKGAVSSAKMAWDNLIDSKKVREAASEKLFEYICVRPFRNMTRAREFRLYIHDGELKLMSQYWLVRKYERLQGRKDIYWEKARNLVDEIAWLLPSDNIVLDIYFTSKEEILLIDFNKWDEPTKPLLAKSWDLDWETVHGIKIIE